MAQQATAHTPKKFEASPDDRARLSRLYEEIEGRHAEMALIIGRILGSNPTDEQFAFSLPARFPWAKIAASKRLKQLLYGTDARTDAETDGGSDGGVTTLDEIHVTIYSDGGVSSGVYNTSTGTCEPIPESEM